MPALSSNKKEKFAQAIAKGVSATKAYVSAGYSKNGAMQGAARLLRNVEICSRVAEIQVELVQGEIALNARTIALEIGNRNARVQVLQDRWQKLRAGLDLILTERGRDMADVPGGASGLLARDVKGKGFAVYRIDTGIVALCSELRATEQQAAQELSQWQTKVLVEERKTLDATPAALVLASMLSLEQLNELERKLAEQQPAQLPAPVAEVKVQ